MQIKTVPLIETQADPETGTFTALASVFGNVDVVGDRMMKGAFKDTLAKWRASGDPIPVILSHKWDDPWATIGQAEPRAVFEDDRGLVVQGTLDMDNPLAKQVHKLMARGLLKGWSFGYTVPKGGQKRANGANEISQVELVEVGPTLKGANPEAQLQAVKSGDLQPDELNWSVALTDDVETKQPAPDSSTVADLVSRMRQLAAGDPPTAEALLAFASRVQNELGKADAPDGKAVWSTAYVNDLPDSAFLYVESGGEKNGDGKTTPRSLRHFPYKNADGSVDLPHLRNALARIPQSNLSQDIKDRLTTRARRLLDDTNTASATDRVEGGKADELRPRDPLRDKFDRILLGLE